MKQISKLLLVAVGVAFLVGCGGGSSQSTASKTYSKGWNAGEAGNYTKAMRLYKKAIEQGSDNGWPENNIGALYGTGKGVPKDKVEALRWFRLGASKGNEIAMGNIGNYYEHGVGGVSASDTEAAKWYRRAGDRSSELARVERRLAAVERKKKEKREAEQRRIAEEERKAAEEKRIAEAKERKRKIKALIARGGDVNKRDADTNTALHIAAKNNEIELLKILIAANADVNIVNKRAETPLHFASSAQAREAVNALLRAGANPYKPNLKNESAMAIAVETGDEDLIGEFVLAGVDANTVADLSTQKAQRDWEAEQEKKRQAEAKRLAAEAKAKAEAEAERLAKEAARREEEADEARREARDLATAAALQKVISDFANTANTAFGQIAAHKASQKAARDAKQNAATAANEAAARAAEAVARAAEAAQQAAAQPAVSYSSVASADSGDGDWANGVAFGHPSSLEADNAALRECHARIDRTCSIVHRFRGKRCAAGANNSKGGGGVAVRSSRSAAESAALSECNALGSSCTVEFSNCASW